MKATQAPPETATLYPDLHNEQVVELKATSQLARVLVIQDGYPAKTTVPDPIYPEEQLAQATLVAEAELV